MIEGSGAPADDPFSDSNKWCFMGGSIIMLR